MTEKEALTRLKRLAKENGCRIREDDFENAHLMGNCNIVIGLSGKSVSSLSFSQCPFNPPEDILCSFRYLEKIYVRASQRDLRWLGVPAGLKCLAIYDWDGEQLPETWESAQTMETLYFYTRRGTIPLELSMFQNLKKIGFDSPDDVYLELPEWFDQYKSLKQVLLRHCRIRAIPEGLVKTGLPFRMFGNRAEGIFLQDATLQKGDLTLFASARNVIDAYYQGRSQEVLECKVIFLGDGGVGKSSLIDRIVRKKYEKNTIPTKGVVMTLWSHEINGSAYTLRFMDFGGQEIMHSMHRCFLTEHTIYVVVCDNRSDSDIDGTVARWLETIRTFAPNSPAILALNKADLNDKVSVSEVGLKNQYPFLKYILKTSATDYSTPYSVKQLIEAICECVPACSSGYKANADMICVMDSLKEMTRKKISYISARDYQDLCENNHITDPGLQQSMLGWFRDLGVAYAYESETTQSDGDAQTYQNLSGLTADSKDKFSSVRVLNPQWLTNGIYRLILSTPNMGFLPHSSIETIMSTPPKENDGQDETIGKTYTREETAFILHVMRKFLISHNNGKTEMIPLKMPKDPPEGKMPEIHPSALHLRWSGRYLPNNLVHQLMIRKFNNLDRSCVWLSGARFFSSYGAQAVVRLDNLSKHLDVYVWDFQADPRVYLGEFRDEIIRVSRRMNLAVQEEICVGMNEGLGIVPFLDVQKQYQSMPDQAIYVPVPDNAGKGCYMRPEILLQKNYLSDVYETNTLSGYEDGSVPPYPDVASDDEQDEEKRPLQKTLILFVLNHLPAGMRHLRIPMIQVLSRSADFFRFYGASLLLTLLLSCFLILLWTSSVQIESIVSILEKVRTLLPFRAG